MSAALNSWAAAQGFALTLPGTEACQHYGRPAVSITANGRSFLGLGGEPDTSFVIHVDLATVEMLMDTEPATYWQSPHYAGYPAVLTRFDSADPERVRDVIRLAHEQAAAKKPVRGRKR